MPTFTEIVDVVALAVDGAGVLIIVVGLLLAMGRFLSRGGSEGAYPRFRQDLGRSILLGLEFLVAGDIIRTVAVSPTLQNVLVLGLIVLVRTFLSMTLQVELEGRWPWHRGKAPGDGRKPERSRQKVQV